MSPVRQSPEPDPTEQIITRGFIVPSLINGWVNLVGAGYVKDAMGFVHLRGRIATGASGTVAFVLPAGFRPIETMVFGLIQSGAGANSYLEILPNGSVMPVGPAVSITAFLESVTPFLAEA